MEFEPCKPYFRNHAVNDEGIVAKLVAGAARLSHFNFHADATQAFIGPIASRPYSF